MICNTVRRRIHAIIWSGLLSLPIQPLVFADSDLPEASESVRPARIELTDESILFGEIIDLHDGTLYVTTTLMGDVEIPLAAIRYLDSDQEIELLTKDQKTLKLSALRMADGEVLLAEENTLDVGQLDVANPEEWEEGHGYHVTGRATSALEVNRGNTETDQFDADFETILESRRDRITMRGDYEEASAIDRSTDGSGEMISETKTTADNWRLVGKYDYFLSDPRNYLGVNLGFSADKFADVKGRSYFGPYYGRKVLTRESLQLDAEIGVSYVATNFESADDDEYMGLNINLTGETEFFDGSLTLYFRQVNIVNLSSMEKSIYRTTLGLRFPLLLGLEGAAEASADYDGGAAEGKEKLDETFKFRVGYSW